ncbi:hypothetical protein LOZ66_002665 [Ophidiomyces ophidiicola]|nr:hypothetical protein LOZ66_002665 [Ophidiomyces ophidiicola]
MSASNPFRRKPVPAAAAALDSGVGEREAATTPAPASPAPPLENTLPPRTKSVRIASPPVRAVISPVEPPSPLATSPPGTSRGRSRHAGSPPPPQVIPRDVGSSSESEDDERPDGLDPFENPKVGRDDEGHVQTGRKRATMDVDAFKRLLLTGDANVQSAALTERNVSMVEQQQQQLPLRSASRSSQDRDAASPRLERKKPPVPKTRHGKLLQHAVDGDIISARDQQPRAPPRVVSDPPPSTSSPGSSSRSSSRDGRRPSLSDAFPPFRSASLRIPPAAPPTRRHSQLRHAHAHAAAGSSPPIARSSSARLPASSTSASASAMPRTPPPPPPPPPTRRRDHESPSSSSHSSPSTTPEEAEDAANQSTTPPPLARSQSGSVRSVTRLARAPRPPPPRRSANAQVSAEDDGGGGGGGAVGPSSPPQPPSKAEDILADLSRLQRELDEFRGRYEKPSSAAG